MHARWITMTLLAALAPAGALAAEAYPARPVRLVVPGWSGTQRAVRRFGAQTVRRLALGGEILLAPEALSLGVVDRVVETGKAFAEAKTWADKIAERGPLATEAAKLMIAVAEGEESAASAEALASGFIALTADLKEGAAAFRGKRKPGFGRS